MPSPREVLNRLKHTGVGFADVELWYRHRGAPNDTRIVTGDAIRGVDRAFLRLVGPRGGASIPWHRVLRIVHGGEVVFLRREA